MALYAACDLHSTNTVLAVIDDVRRPSPLLDRHAAVSPEQGSGQQPPNLKGPAACHRTPPPVVRARKG